MNPYQQAAYLNNEGISSLLSENYQRTVQLMLNSIKVMKREIAKPRTNIRKESHLSPSYSIATIELPMSKNQRYDFIFNQAFQIPDDGEDAFVSRDMYLSCATVVFNLALTHHRQYLNTDTTNDDYQQEEQNQILEKAERLYSTTMKLLENQSCRNNRMGLIIKLACVNNLSSIRADTCFDTATSDLLQNLSFTSSTLFEEKRFQGLIMNMLLFAPHKVAPAA